MVPVVRRPPELVDQGGVGQRGVRGAPRDHEIRVLSKGLQDRSGSHVGVRGRHPLAYLAQGLARLHVAQLVSRGQQLVQPIHQIVTPDDRDPNRTLRLDLPEPLDQSRPACLRVDAARVAHHADALGDQIRRQIDHQIHEVPRVAEGRVPLPLLLQDGHRDLGQVVEHQVVDRPAPDLQLGSLLPIPPESLTGAHAHGPIRHRRAA